MKDCKPGKIRNPKTNRCASPSTIRKQQRKEQGKEQGRKESEIPETHPDIPRENGRCVHISKLSKLSLSDLKKVICEHQLVTPARVTKKILIDKILVHLGIEVEKKCNVGYELNPSTNRCRKSCTSSQTRDPKTQRCRRKIL